MAKNSITIRKERFYPHPPEAVWIALTDARALAEWLEPNDHKPVVGHKFQFRCDPGICGHGVKECEVLEAEAPHRLVWKWVHVPRDADRPRPAPMIIAWTLVPEKDGTRLILEHTGAENINWFLRGLMRVGWGYMMKTLIPKVIQNVDGSRFTPGAIPLKNRGYKCRTVPEEYVR